MGVVLHAQVSNSVIISIIYQISPLSGPVEGGTNVEILGRNLGVQKNHIVQVVIGEEILCDVKKYEPGKR